MEGKKAHPSSSPFSFHCVRHAEDFHTFAGAIRHLLKRH